MQQVAPTKGLLGRGVWVAPWRGPNDEIVLLAVSRWHRLLGAPRIVPAGANHVQASDDLWARVERDDPIPSLHII
jgi:hypothetical protein